MWVADDLARSAVDRDSYALAVGAELRLSQAWSLHGQVAAIAGGEEGVQGSLAAHYAW